MLQLGEVDGKHLPWPAPVKRLKIRIRGELDEFLHEAMATSKRAATVRIIVIPQVKEDFYLCRAAGQIRLLAFLRKGWYATQNA